MTTATQSDLRLARPHPPSTTARSYRRAGLIVAVLALAAMVAAWLFTNELRTSSDEVRTTAGPVLVALQDLNSSLAESDSAASAAFLTSIEGEENRAQRGSYEAASDRGARALVEVATLAGGRSDEVDADLRSINADLGRRAGLFEAARSTDDTERGTKRVVEALEITRDDIRPRIASIQEWAQARFDTESKPGTTWSLVALASLALLAAAVLGVFVFAAFRSRRIVNVPLALSLALVIGLFTHLIASFAADTEALDRSNEGGYRSIDLLSQLQARAYQERSALSVGALTSDSVELEESSLGDIELPTLIEAIRNEAAMDPREAPLMARIGGAADSPRERAVAVELAIRYVRYRTGAEDVAATLDRGDFVGAGQTLSGSTAADFAGFNATLDNALADNRAQFSDALDATDDLTRFLTPVSIAALLGALVLAWIGVGQRLRDFR